jgi:type II secretory pathway pseudopilin PulG
VTGTKTPCPNFRIQGERGYVLLTLLLLVSLLVIAAASVAPSIARQLRRDREDELIHRGAEYRRAIRSFAKHTGRFPLTLDELENTNGTRYLRRRYKDPITGGEFRLLHMADVAAYGSRSDAPSSPPDENGAQTANSANSQPSNVGGGVILGVASPSVKETIREFDHKNHYNQWLFFYSAIYDGSVEAKGPTPLRPVFAAQKNSSEASNQSAQPSSTP